MVDGEVINVSNIYINDVSCCVRVMGNKQFLNDTRLVNRCLVALIEALKQPYYSGCSCHTISALVTKHLRINSDPMLLLSVPDSDSANDTQTNKSTYCCFL